MSVAKRGPSAAESRFRRFCRHVGKDTKNFGILNRKGVKYLISATAVLLFAQGVFGYSGLRTPPFAAAPDTLAAPAVRAGVERPDTAAPSLQPAAESRRERRQRLRSLRLRQSELPQRPDTLPARPDSAS
ncbi:hypothetical protein, partial [uncultured Alistipes sp.]|uniref:hypothetical protein n=1 Tax=uncultured Alistipes sp. TaxID=538949 RepID=UPI002601CDDA